MKRFFSITTAIVFLFNIMGYYAIYELKRVKIKSEVKSLLKEGRSDLGETFILDKDEFSKLIWLDKKEFFREGKLYDVIEMSLSDGMFLIRCFHDSREQDLFAGFKKMNSKDKKIILSLSVQIINIALPEKVLNFEENSGFSEDLQTACKTFHSSYFESPASPPPKSFA